jgi:hypothetical protein
VRRVALSASRDDWGRTSGCRLPNQGTVVRLRRPGVASLGGASFVTPGFGAWLLRSMTTASLCVPCAGCGVNRPTDAWGYGCHLLHRLETRLRETNYGSVPRNSRPCNARLLGGRRRLIVALLLPEYAGNSSLPGTLQPHRNCVVGRSRAEIVHCCAPFAPPHG